VGWFLGRVIQVFWVLKTASLAGLDVCCVERSCINLILRVAILVEAE
jgi:hypothetical protein